MPVRSGARAAAVATSASDEAEIADPDRSARFVGRVLAGRYEVKRVLGRGGMGIVYEARHITVGRAVAIKLLRHDLARSTQAVARFHREAQAAAAIGSEHIVDVFDFGYTDDGDAFIAMELLEGEDLGRIIRREGALNESRALMIARQVARALEPAHSKGIIHRDLKSENIFVIRRDDGEFVKLLDFGISKVSEGDEGRGPVTSEGVVMGTPHYMAPEQAMSALEADHRIDLYALGCLLYEMLTGRVPFTGRNPVEVVFKHVHEAPTPPSKLRADLSTAVDAVVLRALAKNRDERFGNAAEMLAALASLSTTFPSGEARTATRSSRPEAALAGANSARSVAPTQSPRWLLATSVAVVAGTVSVVALWPARRSSTTQREATHASVTDGAVAHFAAPALTTGLAPDATQPIANAPTIVVADTALRVEALPRTASIAVDGDVIGIGGGSQQYVRGSTHHVTVQAAGYLSQSRDVLLSEPTSLTVALAPTPTGNVSARILRDGGARHGNDDAGLTRGVGGESHPIVAPGIDPAEGLKNSPYGSEARPR